MPQAEVALAECWRRLLIRGIVSIAFGFLAFNFPIGIPIATTGTLALLCACYLLVDCAIGFWISEAARPRLQNPQSWSPYVVTRALEAADPRLQGPLLFEAAAGFILALLPLLLVFRGLNVLAGSAARAFPEGPLEFLYGIPTLDDVPGIISPLITLRSAIWVALFWSLLLRGVPLLLAAVRLPSAYGSWWLGSAGVVSLLWGFLLRLYAPPEPSALIAWFGAYALLFGATMVAFALRLRTPRHDALNPFEAGFNLRGISHVLFRASEFVATGLLAGVIVVLSYVLVFSMERQTIDIRNVTVPKQWEEQGYTSLVAARQLRDAINQIIADADSAMPAPQYSAEGPEVVVHEVWLQPEAIAGWLGTWLGLRRKQDVSGEITLSGCYLRLRVRFNDSPLVSGEQRPLTDICKDCICSSRLNDRFAVQDGTNCPIRIGTPSCCGANDGSNASEQIGSPLGT
ncbi:MAG TPA: hypothetical protein VKI44_27235, partial [Acetobacteraceae bacterium]|nr:hypothetical protein [Acetobacteraceae bacterium]